MFKEVKKIRERNNSPHARMILILLLLEKKCWLKRIFRILRVIVVQGIYHVELDPRTFEEEAIATLRLPHPYNIVVHGDARIGVYCTIFHNVTIGARERRNGEKGVPQIGDNVLIGTGSVVLGNISVADGSKIGASSVVLKNVQSGTVCGIVK